MEDKTGSAFCGMEEDTTKNEWMAQLRHFNAVFQAELLAIQEVCLWASKTNQQVKLWPGSRYRSVMIKEIINRLDGGLHGKPPSRRIMSNYTFSTWAVVVWLEWSKKIHCTACSPLLRQ
ncbi:hypothetical protein AVEN_81287-1 [Araneus ventricosus]|uniref:Uncharacterized protein n=1 Tax=Araneus ventricosus TaxID=182803 RepID=A0A4Y2B5P8_ARAVE|nr:hypothetical protein AVEN_81287-1 [Araneus ventricosus]